MSIMDLYHQVVMEKLGINQPADPVTERDTKKTAKKVKRKQTEASVAYSHGKKRSSGDSERPPTKKIKFVEAKKANICNKMTDDGFKIVSEVELPEDDSDISDAFISDVEDDTENEMKEIEFNGHKNDKKIKSLNCKSVDSQQNVSGNKYTDDGFRIVSSIPDDDLDVSDAFETDESECEEETDNLKVANEINKLAVVRSSFTDKSSVGNIVKFSNENSVIEQNVACGESTEGELKKKKKRKRGPRNKNESNTDPNSASKTIPKSKTKKDRDKKNRKPKKETVQLAEEDIEAIKAKIPPKIQNVITEFGLDWARFDTAAEREKREMAKLPQPQQIPNCITYLKKDPASGKIITVYDYSKKRGGSKTGPTAGAAKTGALALNAAMSGKQTAVSGSKQPVVVGTTVAASNLKSNKNAKPGGQLLTKEQLELIEKNKQMKAEHLEELRGIKRKVNDLVNKSLDPRTKDQRRLAVIEKLGGIVKKPHINYKVLMANKKKEKEEAEVARENLKNLGMHDLLKKKRRERRKKDPNEVAGFNSLGGRIRDGVMVIHKTDIAKLST